MSNPTANHFELLDSLEIFYEEGKVDVTDGFYQMSVTEDLFKAFEKPCLKPLNLISFSTISDKVMSLFFLFINYLSSI